MTVHKRLGWLLLAGALASSCARAHVIELIPDKPILQDVLTHRLHLDVRLTNPSEGSPAVPMDPPEEFGVDVNSHREILTHQLKENSTDEPGAYSMNFDVKGPGDHIFYLVSKPRWEPSQQRMVTDYTKVVVDAYGLGGSWDTLLGFPIEIQPLSRPYALWTGNVFQGIVLRQGEPVPYAEVKVVFHNPGTIALPADSYAEQIIRADANGTFTYGIPMAGWWAFSSTTLAEQPLKNPQGERVNHEITTTLWVNAITMDRAH